MRATGAMLGLTLGLVGCAVAPPVADEQTFPAATRSTVPAGSSEPASSAVAPDGGSVAFVSVVDGDTIETSVGTVRLIGIDTPEQGECGHNEASMTIGRLLSAGDEVTLELPVGQNDRDRYGRLVRYVTTTAGVDLGLAQLEAGNAVARYDSTDGYPAHPRETSYRAAQLATTEPDGSVTTTACRDRTAPTPMTPTTSADDVWWQQYPSCSRLKKNTVGDPIGPFDRDDPAQAEIYEWFAYGTGNNGDGDSDGLTCE